MSPESFTDFRGSSHIISHPHLVIVKIFVEKFGKVIGGGIFVQKFNFSILRTLFSAISAGRLNKV